ncbi:MAG: hypothetical protein ACOY6K_12470 [Pseudomonadota bacterium]
MAEFQHIKRACALIARDNGGINRDRPERQQEREMEAWLARQPSELLPGIDAWLGSLSQDDLDTVCTGEVSDQDRILSTAPPFTNGLLEAYFHEVC